MPLTIIVFLFTLLILVVSHELGHFAAAKKFGIKVLEFGFGLPPRIWGKQVGDTLVSLNWLPIGGFVRLFGEDETESQVLKAKDSFASKPVWQRIGVVVAGVSMNLLLAIILFWVVLFAQGFKEKIPLLTDFKFVGVNQVNETTIFIGQVVANSPASEAGISQGDQVVGVNGSKVDTANQLIDYTKEHAGEKIVLDLEDSQGNVRKVEVTPRVNPPEGQGPLGIQLGTVSIAQLNYQSNFQKITAGPVHAYNLTTYSLSILGRFISAAIETRDLEPVSQTVSGPVGLTNMTSAILSTKSPFIPYLNFVALLSLNLAIINILPFPALDGGRLVFLLVEAAIGKRVKPEVEKWVHTVGMILLITLIILITFSDIKKFF